MPKLRFAPAVSDGRLPVAGKASGASERAMGVFDRAARFAAQADPGVVPRRLLAGSGLLLRFRDWLDTRTLPLPGGPDRTADLVVALDDPAAADKPWLLVL